MNTPRSGLMCWYRQLPSLGVCVPVSRIYSTLSGEGQSIMSTVGIDESHLLIKHIENQANRTQAEGEIVVRKPF